MEGSNIWRGRLIMCVIIGSPLETCQKHSLFLSVGHEVTLFYWRVQVTVVVSSSEIGGQVAMMIVCLGRNRGQVVSDPGCL